MCETYTIKDYLQGKVRDFEISDKALSAICADAGIASMDCPFDELSEKDKKLALAYTYVWVALGPSSSAKWSEKDGDWSQSGGGQELTADQIRSYLRMANGIFEEYGLDTVKLNSFKMRGGGFRNVRKYGHNTYR